MCGDSTNADDVARLMQGEKAGGMIGDPPYGMNLAPDWSKASGRVFQDSVGHWLRGKTYDPVIGDNEGFDAKPIILAYSDPEQQFWFGADYYASTLPNSEHSGAWLVWDKRLSSSRFEQQPDASVPFDSIIGSQFELIWSKMKCRRIILRHLWAGGFGLGNKGDERRWHPTQKPTGLLVQLIDRFTDLIVDPFLGSGTTLIAAEKLGRICYGMEIAEKYVSVCLQRFLDFTGIEPRLA